MSAEDPRDACALNWADDGEEMTHQQIGELLGMSDENVRLIEADLFERMAPELRALGLVPDGYEPPVIEPEPEPELKSRPRKKADPNQLSLFEEDK